MVTKAIIFIFGTTMGNLYYKSRLCIFGRAILSLITCLALFSCGGGTSGTSQTGDSQYRLVSGTLVDSTGKPFDNIQVVLSGNESKTDSKGAFLLTGPLGTSLELSAIQNGNNLEIPVRQVISDSAIVNVYATINSTSAKSLSSELAVQVLGACSEKIRIEGNTIRVFVPAEGLLCDLQFIYRYEIGNFNYSGFTFNPLNECSSYNYEIPPLPIVKKGEYTDFRKIRFHTLTEPCQFSAILEPLGAASLAAVVSFEPDF